MLSISKLVFYYNKYLKKIKMFYIGFYIKCVLYIPCILQCKLYFGKEKIRKPMFFKLYLITSNFFLMEIVVGLLQIFIFELNSCFVEVYRF